MENVRAGWLIFWPLGLGLGLGEGSHHVGAELVLVDLPIFGRVMRGHMHVAVVQEDLDDLLGAVALALRLLHEPERARTAVLGAIVQPLADDLLAESGAGLTVLSLMPVEITARR